MIGRSTGIAGPLLAACVCAAAIVTPQADLAAQGRGGRVGGPAPTGRAGAPVDLTGTWVSVVTEDWQWRMITPKKGDFESVPLNAEGQRVLATWDPSKDGMCETYGVGGLMRLPLRLRISWQDDLTLKIESDAGQQTRLIRFAPAGGRGTPAPAASAAPAGERTLQGVSIGEWVGGGAGNLDPFTGRGDGPGQQRWGALRVRTTGMRAGWLRRNGVPYSENAVVNEYVTRFTHPEAGDWFVVTTTVEDPTYLTGPFTTSSNFKKEPNDSKWNPTPCRS
jgi:hypothetical protein